MKTVEEVYSFQAWKNPYIQALLSKVPRRKDQVLQSSGRNAHEMGWGDGASAYKVTAESQNQSNFYEGEK